MSDDQRDKQPESGAQAAGGTSEQPAGSGEQAAGSASGQPANSAADKPATADAAGAADAEKEAKRKAAAEARAARAAAKAAETAEAAPAEPKAPSPNQPRLDEAVRLVREALGEAAVAEAFINEMNGDMPTLVIASAQIREVGLLFKQHPQLGCDYLRNVSGVDYETHLEVVYHLINLTSKADYALKVKTDRETPSVPSVTPIWATANWNEREIYDLLGIDFPGHPDLRRIMMPDDWVGHPLRKDYEPLDPEV